MEPTPDESEDQGPPSDDDVDRQPEDGGPLDEKSDPIRFGGRGAIYFGPQGFRAEGEISSADGKDGRPEILFFGLAGGIAGSVIWAWGSWPAGLAEMLTVLASMRFYSLLLSDTRAGDLPGPSRH